MRNDYKLYYSFFSEDEETRVREFEDFMASDYFTEEEKQPLQKWYNVLVASVPNMGDKMAKYCAMSVFQFLLSNPHKQKELSALGWLINSHAPDALRAKR